MYLAYTQEIQDSGVKSGGSGGSKTVAAELLRAPSGATQKIRQENNRSTY